MSDAHKLHLTFYEDIGEQRKAWERLKSIKGRGSVSRFIAKAVNAYPLDDEETDPDCRNEPVGAIIERFSKIADRMEDMLAACANGQAGKPADDTGTREATKPENNPPDEKDVDMDFLGDFM